MLKKLYRHLVLAIGAAVVSGSLWAKGPTVDDSMWIVELQDAPTVQFRGGVPQQVTTSASDTRKPMRATAPAATGAERLRPDSTAVREYAAYLDGQRRQVLARAESDLGLMIQPRFVYRHLRNGFAAAMSPAEAKRLASLPGVRSIQPDFIQRVHTDAGPEWMGAPALWNGSTDGVDATRGEGTVLGVVDTGVNWDSIFFDVARSNLPLTNPRGEFFGLCNDQALDIPCSDKLIGVYDFTDENTNGFDPDGHGSHVASTAVGLPLAFELNFGTGPIPFQTSGVAPRASFISYKACEADPDEPAGNFICRGTATSAALEQAIEDEVDVVNFSIGGEAFNPWDAGRGNQRLFLNLREAGIVPAVSAGNDGPADGTVGSPANVPWVMAVANAEHGRVLANRLVDVSGGAFALGDLVGEGTTEGTGILPIVHARDFGNALCGTGPPELGPSCDENTGASNPFPSGTFDGQIVVCDRGEYGRIEKGKNVELAGAAGMILANTDLDGESTASDEHCLPATHVGQAQGDRLRDWLATGSDQRGRLTGTERFIDPQAAGRLAQSSSRGPAEDAPDVMKPNVTAPGSNILAAGTDINETADGPSSEAANQVLFLTGTSMSSPHVAGAALLVRSANPAWGVDEVISALETTAVAAKVRNGDDSDARVPDRGAGGVQVDQAARIGLYLSVSENEFLDANPSRGGDPGTLNLPGIASNNCVGNCTFTRTVRALRDGTWRASAAGDLDIDVSPTSLDLAAGEEREIEIRISRGSIDFGQWAAGSVVLDPDSSQLATQRLPVGAFIAAGEAPEEQSFVTQTSRGRDELTIPELVDLDELVIRTSPLLRPTRREPSLAPDPTQGDAFDGSAGTVTEFVEVKPDSMLLLAETFASTAPDIDLFVGRDRNGDGVAQEAEIVCESISPDEIERCEVEFPEAGTWWIHVQSFTGSGSSDRVPFEFAVFREEADPSLVVTAPGAHPGGSLTVPVYWDQPAMLRGQRWRGVIGVASAPDKSADIGLVPLRVTRSGENTPAETALFNDRTEPVVLPSDAIHDRLYIDVPPGMASLDFVVEGSLADVTIRRRGFDELVDSVPLTPPAPTAIEVQADQAGDGWTASVDNPESGRYFVVLDNAGPDETRVDVTAAAVRAQAGTPPVPRLGLWTVLNRDIDIRQGVEWQVGGGGRFALWYTYDEDGSPTFYITDTVPDDGSAFFKAALFRSTSNGERSSLKAVGEVQITAIAEDRFMYAWRLNGNHGAEMFGPVNGRTCPTVSTLGPDPSPLLGHWFSPDASGEGVTLLITDSSEAWIRYYYDDANEPRWVLADEELPATLPGGNRMEVLDFRGWCIYCEEGPITLDVVGTLERAFIDTDTVREVSDYVAGPPLNSSVNVDRNLLRLSSTGNCANQDE